MNLVEKVKDSFPGLETKDALNEHRNTVLDFMNRNSAICAKEKGEIVGVLLFSNENNELCFLAVATERRRQHIAEKMLSYMHMAHLNGRVCGAKRPKCEAERSHHL